MFPYVAIVSLYPDLRSPFFTFSWHFVLPDQFRARNPLGFGSIRGNREESTSREKFAGLLSCCSNQGRVCKWLADWWMYYYQSPIHEPIPKQDVLTRNICVCVYEWNNGSLLVGHPRFAWFEKSKAFDSHGKRRTPAELLLEGGKERKAYPGECSSEPRVLFHRYSHSRTSTVHSPDTRNVALRDHTNDPGLMYITVLNARTSKWVFVGRNPFEPHF